MKKSEYEKSSSEFRAMLSREFVKPPEEQNIPTTRNWMNVPVIAVCATEGCRNQDKGLKTLVAEPADGVYKVLCGMCNSAIEHLDPMFEDDPEYLLPVRYPNGESWLKGT